MQLTRFPRRQYTHGPTPLEPLRHLSRHLGGPSLYIKRDDLLGLAGGGNKTRKLEFLVADALRAGADTLVTIGALQSNHCRLTLAAAIREGLRCRLVLQERGPGSYDPEASGNNFLYRLLGAEEIRVIEGDADRDAALARVRAELEEEGRQGYAIPVGGSNAIGSLGYVDCAQELLWQAREQGVTIDHIVCASGSMGTHAGLLAGLHAMSAGVRVTGISVSGTGPEQGSKLERLADEVFELLEVDASIPADAVTVFDAYVGAGYPVPTEDGLDAVRELARREGILLDTVYTGKVMAGLIDLVRTGYFEPDENVLFLHTGGAPSLFAHTQELLG